MRAREGLLKILSSGVSSPVYQPFCPTDRKPVFRFFPGKGNFGSICAASHIWRRWKAVRIKKTDERPEPL